MKKLVPLITIVLIVCLGVFIWKSKMKDYEEAARYQEWDYLRQPISERIDELEETLERLEEEFEKSKLPKGTVEILFTDLDKKVYEKCFPLLDEYGYTATLALSSSQLPGMDGCITKEQFQELMDAGWETCVKFDGTSLEDWWTVLKADLDNRQIKKPREIYFPEGKYEASMDSSLKRLGFTIAIAKNSGKSPIVLKDEDGIWHVGAIGYMNAKSRIWMDEAIQKDGNMVYCVGFSEENELYQAPAFPSMLNYFDYNRALGEMAVMNIDEAREHYTARITGENPKLVERYQKKKERLEGKLADVKKQLEELDAQYE